MYAASAPFSETAPRWKAFAKVNPKAAAWLVANRETNGFANSLTLAVIRWGRLTDKQMDAVMRNVNRPAAVAPFSAPVDARKIVEAFNNARAAGLKRIKLVIGGLVFKAAPMTGRNPGAIYVTSASRTGRDFRTGDTVPAYLGKVDGLTFTASRDATPAEVLEILNVSQDPAAAARTSGIQTGVCSCCSRELTDPVSVARGIGPICEQRFGWSR